MPASSCRHDARWRRLVLFEADGWVALAAGTALPPGAPHEPADEDAHVPKASKALCDPVRLARRDFRYRRTMVIGRRHWLRLPGNECLCCSRQIRPLQEIGPPASGGASSHTSRLLEPVATTG